MGKVERGIKEDPNRKPYPRLEDIDSDMNVLVTGETGTGKELVAKASTTTALAKMRLPFH